MSESKTVREKVLAVYPDAEIMTSDDRKGGIAYQVVTFPDNVGTAASHKCASAQSAWRSALAWIEGRKSRKKGENTGRKAKVSIQLPNEDKARIERKHGSVQAFVNHYAAKVK